MLGQCRMKFDSEQTLSRHRPNIFTVLGSIRVRLTESHKKSLRWACALWRVDSLKFFKTRMFFFCFCFLLGLDGTIIGENVEIVWYVHSTIQKNRPTFWILGEMSGLFDRGLTLFCYAHSSKNFSTLCEKIIFQPSGFNTLIMFDRFCL